VNAVRSLAKYLADSVLLGGDWEVRWSGQAAGEEGFERPYCGIVPSTGRATVPLGPLHAEMRQTFSVVAFCVEGLNTDSSMIEAGRVEALLTMAFARGHDPVLYSARSPRAHPRRVPAWDFSEVGLFEAATDADRIAPMRVVETPAFQTIADGHGRYCVAGDVRLAWVENVSVPSTRPLVERVAVAFED